jgi:cytochrome c553
MRQFLICFLVGSLSLAASFANTLTADEARSDSMGQQRAEFGVCTRCHQRVEQGLSRRKGT